MQRLAKPSDYVLQEVLGQQMYLIPWEPRMCPGNPADDPELGAQLYNEFACAAAQGVTQRSPAEKTADIIDWAITTPGEAARSLAADLAATYLGKHQFRMEGVVCGRGRNPTLRLWPTIFSGKIDVFPGDRRSRLISSMTSVAPA